MILALSAARESVLTVGITGSEHSPRFAALCDGLVVIPSNSTPLIQQVTIVAIHAICAAIDQEFAP